MWWARACSILLIGAGCTNAQARTIAEASKPAAVAYEAAARAWLWLDAWNASSYENYAKGVMDSIEAARPEFEAKCGPDGAKECMMSYYLEVMQGWEESSGYAKRTVSIEAARVSLIKMEALLSADTGHTVSLKDVAKTLAVLLDEIVTNVRSAGGGVPAIVSGATGLLRGLL